MTSAILFGEGPGEPVPIAVVELLLGPERSQVLLARVGLEPPFPAAIAPELFWRTLRENILETGDERHGLGPAIVPIGSFDLLLASMGRGRNLADGLGRLAAASNILWPDLRIRVVRAGGASLRIDGPSLGTPSGLLYAELFSVVVHCAACWMTNKHLVPQRLSLPRSTEAGIGAVLRQLGTVHRGSARIEIGYGPADSALALEPTNSDMWHALLQANFLEIASAPTRIATDRLGRRVREILLAKIRGQAEVAAALGTSVPTMRRRLLAEGTSFRAIKADVRRALVADGLTGDRRLEDLAADVGFSEARSLRRVATRWFGAPPSALRQETAGRSAGPQPKT